METYQYPISLLLAAFYILLPLVLSYWFGYTMAEVKHPTIRWGWYVLGFGGLFVLPLMVLQILELWPGGLAASLVGVFWGVRRYRSGAPLLNSNSKSPRQQETSNVEQREAVWLTHSRPERTARPWRLATSYFATPAADARGWLGSLNGWMRLWVVLSVLWGLVSAVIVGSELASKADDREAVARTAAKPWERESNAPAAQLPPGFVFDRPALEQSPNSGAAASRRNAFEDLIPRQPATEHPQRPASRFGAIPIEDQSAPGQPPAPENESKGALRLIPLDGPPAPDATDGAAKGSNWWENDPDADQPAQSRSWRDDPVVDQPAPGLTLMDYLKALMLFAALWMVPSVAVLLLGRSAAWVSTGFHRPKNALAPKWSRWRSRLAIIGVGGALGIPVAIWFYFATESCEGLFGGNCKQTPLGVLATLAIPIVAGWLADVLNRVAKSDRDDTRPD